MRKLTLLTTIILLFGHVQNSQSQCIQWTKPSSSNYYGDFNGPEYGGGAPCDEGDGCPFYEADFEIYASEAYGINNFVQGGTYTFSICNGPNAGSWIPEFTIIDPNGFVEAYGAGDGDSCSFTWTAALSGRYIIIINSKGNCANGPFLSTPNGFPAITCADESVLCTAPDTVCEAGSMTNLADINLCPGKTANITTLGANIPTGGGFAWTFTPDENASGGTAPNILNLRTTETDYDFNDSLNGVLELNDLEPLRGTWTVQGRVGTIYNNIQNTVCDTTAKKTIVFLADTESVCQGACDTVEISVTFTTTNESVEGANDGAITATASGGDGDYSFLWADQQKTSTIENLSPGVYYLEVYDGNLCSSGVLSVTVSSGIEICETTNLVIQSTVTDESFDGANDGAIDITVSGGTGNYTYVWSNGAITEDLHNLGPNLYTVTVKDENDCSKSAQILVSTESVGINSLSNISELRIFPNPIQNDVLYVSASAFKSQSYTISIWSITGRLISSQKRMIDQNSQFELDCSKLETGNYLFKIAGKEEFGVLKFQILK